MRKIIVFIIFLLLIGAILMWLLPLVNPVSSPANSDQSLPTESVNQTQPIEKTARFAIFTNGTKRIFTEEKYHNRSTDVFITANNPNLVNIKNNDTSWNDFFKTLPSPMKLTKTCLTTGTGQVFCSNETQTLKFYLNGNLNKDALDQNINQGDTLLVSYGKENEEQIKTQLQELE